MKSGSKEPAALRFDQFTYLEITMEDFVVMVFNFGLRFHNTRVHALYVD